VVQVLKKFPKLAKMVRYAGGMMLHRPDIVLPCETIGSAYGSHTILSGKINRHSVVYSFGIGNDVTFDLGLIERFDCRVHGFDPTPRSTAWVTQNVTEPLFVFHQYGIGECDADVAFEQPEKDDHFSFSKAADANRGNTFPVRRLSTIKTELGHSHIDILKLDVEGFEYAVLKDIVACGIFPSVIAVEFHHRMHGIPNSETITAVNNLRAAGYQLFFVSETGREYSFAHMT
jgi:FkbM family methyltransferase